MYRSLSKLRKNCVFFKSSLGVARQRRQLSSKMYQRIITPQQDARLYKYLVLPSGLRVLLISDPEADKAAAAMDVRVGSYNDPPGVMGLAHFCEHMLFLGTEKYPDESEYGTYLSSHGGQHNAFTLPESTNYFFDVAWDALDGALDRFAQFFIAPKFTESGTQREVEAIESEHNKNLQSDSRRGYQLACSTASPSHPMHQFSTGSLETLRVHADIREKLLRFYESYYSSNVMRLVVLGRESLESLEESVREKFSAVEDRRVVLPVFNGRPYEPEQLGTRVRYAPVKELRLVELFWPMPPQQGYYREKPIHYLSELLGHEGRGSVLYWLRKLGWANALSAGTLHDNTDYAIFSTSIELTREGEDHVDEIVDVVYAYLSLVRARGVRRDLFEEQRLLSELGFSFKDREEAICYVSTLAMNMQLYPESHVLCGPYLIERFDESLIRRFLECLTPGNMRCHVCSPRYRREGGACELDRVEKYYGIEYRMEPIARELLDRWERLRTSSEEEIGRLYGELDVPRLNPFVPDDLELKPLPEGSAASEYPEMIEDSLVGRAWYKRDRTYNRPKMVTALDVCSPCAYASPAACVKTRLVVELLEDELNERTYEARLAGLKYSVMNTCEGLHIWVSGYNCKQHVLIEMILEKLRHLKISQDRYRVIRQAVEQFFQNQLLCSPYNLAFYNLSVALESARWHNRQYIHSIKDMTIEQVQQWVPELLDQLYIEYLIYGNVTEGEARNLVRLTESTLSPRPCLSGQGQHPRLVRLEAGKEYVYQECCANPEETNVAIVNYYQVDMTNHRLSMLNELLVQVLHPEAFSQLRTTEQLGYVVLTDSRRDCCVEGFFICIQSNKVDPQTLDERIEQFLQTAKEQYLVKMSRCEFERHRQSLAIKRLKRIESLKKQAVDYWSQILSPRQYEFDYRQREVAALETITLEDLVEFFDEHISASSSRRRKFSSQIWRHGAEPVAKQGPQVVPVDELFRFKHCMPLFGVLPPGKFRMQQ
ncbi:insulin-degrading enzyme-like [Schistocerca gregaria]|uniref:insulin-degrading enzyme-like n=1 Tax=Schistocerca gregaria TaxID=7010 RepID=UPI00211EA4D8|nr:insulin-degrading enzyme-like [Schistocerca gregaria]